MSSFRWQQTTGTVRLSFPGPQTRRREDVEMVLTSNNVRVGSRGSAPSAEGVFFAPVRPTTLRWGFRASSVVLCVDKAQKGVSWPQLFQSIPNSSSSAAVVPETRRVRATYAYQAADPYELSMNDGDLITVVAEDPSGWWKGELNGVAGVFPSNFTEAVDEPDEAFDVEEETGAGGGGGGGQAQQAPAARGGVGLGAAVNAEMAEKLLRRTQTNNSGIAAPAQGLHQASSSQPAILTTSARAPPLGKQSAPATLEPEQQEHAEEGGDGHGTTPEQKAQQSPQPQAEPGTAIPVLNVKPGEKGYVRATFDYEAQAEGELAFHLGDVITVLAQDPSGWWQGENNGMYGWFPANFTEVAQPQEPTVEEQLESMGRSVQTLGRMKRSTGPRGRKSPAEKKLGATLRTWDDTDSSPGAQQQQAEAAAKPRPGVPGTGVTDELQQKLQRAAAATGGAKVPPPQAAAGRGSAPPKARPPPTPQGGAKPPAPSTRMPPRPGPPAPPSGTAQQPQAAGDSSGSLPFPVKLRPQTPQQQDAAQPVTQPAAPAAKEGQPKARPRPPVPQVSSASPRPEPPVSAPPPASPDTQPSQGTPASAVAPASEKAATGPADWPKSLPPFSDFCQELVAMAGALSPQLGFCLCALDGKTFSHNAGDSPVTLASAILPALYALNLEESGSDVLARHVPKEPSAAAPAKTATGPWSAAGAVGLASLYHAGREDWERVSSVVDRMCAAANTKQVGSSMPVYLRSLDSSEAEWLAAYAAKSGNTLPDGCKVKRVVRFLLQLESLQMSLDSAATYAATLANDGSCPGGKKGALPSTKHVISMLSCCGLARDLGNKVPSLSTTGFAILAIPRVLGLAIRCGASATDAPADFVRQISGKYRFK